ncbi:MAG: SMC family ATPase [Candidatus Absconditabacterales bacterium]
MLDLLSISYKNIGPFKKKIFTIFFEQGKFLVKAPIGSGKSFLFFDGPIFALYKYSSRNILNNTCKDGFIKLLFSVNGEKYLLVRNLTKGKLKDGCASVLYNISGDLNDEKVQNNPFFDQDIQDILKQNKKISLQEIDFKNETDLQQNLSSLLPPKEVFLNTVFLMQDSENIFELTPADRLTVLKNVFNILGIDEAKELIAEKKREITYKLKSTEDFSKYNDKLKNLIDDYLSLFQNFLNKNSLSNLSKYKSFFDDVNLIKDKINITEFTFDSSYIQIINELESFLDTNKIEVQKLMNQKENIDENLKSENEKIIVFNSQLKEYSDSILLFTEKIKQIDPEKINKIKLEKNNLQNKLLDLEKNLAKKEISDFYSKNKDSILFNFDDGNVFNLSEINLNSAYLLIQNLKNRGKVLSEEMKKIDMQIKNKELEISSKIGQFDIENKNLLEKKDNYNLQIKKIIEKIQIFEKDLNEQETFACEKIQTNCPFIKIINKKTFEGLEKQRATLQEEKLSLEKDLNQIEILLKSKSKEKLLFDQQEIEIKNEVKKLLLTIKDIETNLSDLKDFLELIDWKSIEKNYFQSKEIENEIKNSDSIILKLESETQKLDEYKFQIQKLNIQQKNNEEQISESNNKIKKFQIDKNDVQTKLEKINYQEILEIDKMTIKFKEVCRDVDSLLKEYKNVQVQIKQLQESEKIISDLYIILSKELLLLVLQDSIPILTEIINNYLIQVVDYQINLKLIKTSSDKLELEAKIFDQDGERDIKSLSGGQKIILKLVWMFAISSYMQSPILFLDETINNLDIDAVGKVSDMLENFVKQRSMKLYAVTHNQQIQQMGIWDSVIEVDRM